MRHYTMFFLVLCAGLLPNRLVGQTDTACTYETCALRVQPGLFAWRIVRGTEARPVATLGLGTGTSLPWTVRGSERAVEHARKFEQKSRRALPFALGGAVLITASSLAMATGGSEVAAAGLVAGPLLQLYGHHQHVQAQRELNEALLWYNRDLPR